MHKDWTTAAKKAGIAAKQIPDILKALEMDPEHPSPNQVKVFQTACGLIKEGQTIPEAIEQMVSQAQQQQLRKDHLMANVEAIRELYPQLPDEHIYQGLELIGVGPDVAEFPAAKMDEFKQLQDLIEAGQLESWDDIRTHWQRVQSEQLSKSPPPTEAITVSQSGKVAVPSTIPAEIQESLAVPILETVQEDVEEIPGRMAEYHQQARGNVMGGLEGFVKGTYYQGVNQELQSPEFVSKVREALQSGKSQPSSES